MPAQDFELLKFPTVYPIKVVCHRAEAVREQIDAIVQHHCPDLVAGDIRERNSGAGRYVSITYSITARSTQHVTELLAELKSHVAVVMIV